MKRVIGDNPELAEELTAKIREALDAKRAEHKTGGNPFLPSKDPERVDETSAPAEDDGGNFDGASSGNEDLFGDDFELDIED